jgi:starvation-inducible outer membrane lipoprotein
MKRKTKRLILIVGIVATLAFALTACTSPAARQVEQQAASDQQSLTLRVIDLISEGKL